MPLIDANYSAGTGARYSLAAGDDLRIARGVAVWSTDLYGVQSAVGGHTVSIDGILFGLRGGVSLSGNANTITIGKTGYVMSEVHSQDNLFASAAISLVGYGQNIVNQGNVVGRIGVALDLVAGQFAQESQLQNDGRIFGHKFGILVTNTSDTRLLIENNGVLASRGFALSAEGSTENVHFTNVGIVRGNILFGEGQDRYDGRSGVIISSSNSRAVISGGGGDDVFAPGLSAESFVGGAGIDTVDFLTSKGVTFSLLKPSIGVGVTKGDLYTGIERFIGSSTGADFMEGAQASESYLGLGGRDTISAWSGDDTLIGGSGIDRLTGGSGNDVFIFESSSDFGDIITDFSSSGTNGNDEIWISLIIGGGLQEGVLDASQFVTSTTNRAKDLSDRFILRTTDKTLWFDPDGLGGGAPRLVADLQQTATMVASDIRIVDI